VAAFVSLPCGVAKERMAATSGTPRRPLRRRRQPLQQPAHAAGFNVNGRRVDVPIHCDMMHATTMARIGLISDTHSLLRPQALAFLQGCNHIVHAGDIGDAAILQALAAVAPLTAVRGNNDKGQWAQALPATEMLRLGDILLYAVHDIADLDLDPAAAGIDVVVSGHSHQPRVEQRDGVLFVNPGSAGPRRFRLPVAVAELQVTGRSVSARVVELDGDGSYAAR
jgi:putative phosphoesterase